jgi:glycosyltransferase involved in cell wall biosynthesis
MNFKVCFIERRDPETSSIEKVFRRVAQGLEKLGIRSGFSQMPSGNSAAGMLKNLLRFRPPNADIYHITGHVHYLGLIMPVRNTVLTIHDLTILHVRKGLRRFLIKKLLFDWPVGRLRYITTISENTKNELVEVTGCGPDKIRVIENPLTIETSRRHSGEFRTEKPVILQVGTAPHKNLDGLVKALKGLECILRVIGPISDEQRRYIADSGISMENLVDLNNEEMVSQYLDADVLVFCSKVEGFGLPNIEAQASGLPVVTSDRPPMHEVAGPGAVLADPDVPGSIRKAIQRIASDSAFRKGLVEAGYQNTRRFALENIAEQYSSLYRDMLAAENRDSFE